MSRKVIEVVQVLIDRIHQGGYTQRALEDDIYAESQKRIAAEKDRDHWKLARQEAHEAGELMQAEIETLRQRLADAEHPPAMAQQRDEIAYLRARLDEERSVSARLRQQLDAARAEVETLREQLADAQLAVSDAFAEVNSVRQQLDAANAAQALWQADSNLLERFAATVRSRFNPGWTEDDLPEILSAVSAVFEALAELDAGTEPAPCPECERLRAVIDQAWQRIQQSISHADVAGLLAALAEIQSNSSVTITSSPTPVAEPLDAEENDTCPGT